MFELLGCLGYCLHVTGVVLVPLLQRKTRVARCQALRFGSLEGDVLPVGFAAVILAESGAAQCPSGCGGDWRLHLGQADSGHFVAGFINSGHEYGVGG